MSGVANATTLAAVSPSLRGAPGHATWLTVIGCLPDGTLAPGAPRAALGHGRVFGAARLLEAANVPPSARHPWERPFAASVEAILARRGEPTTVLATGDPMHYGVGGTLAARLTAGEMAVFPAPSAFSLAAAALGWPLETCVCASLHNAPPSDILRHVGPGRRTLALTRDGAAPTAIAAALVGAGLGEAAVAVAEALATEKQHVTHGRARDIKGSFHPLNVFAVEAIGRAPVRADDLSHDGCVTRDEVRLLTVAALDHGRGHLWDVGAGSGAVAIDWCRAGGEATLFERHGARCAAIRANLAASGAEARLVEGDAPASFAGERSPDAVFLGGGLADGALFEAAWRALSPDGVFVSNAVTLEGEAATLARHASHGGTLTRIALSHGARIGALATLRPALPVLQWRAVKPGPVHR